jgi:hypothetical protein
MPIADRPTRGGGFLSFKPPEIAMEPEQLYSEAAATSAETARYWATQAKRQAQSINAESLCLFTFAVNFLITLILLTLTR